MSFCQSRFGHGGGEKCSSVIIRNQTPDVYFLTRSACLFMPNGPVYMRENVRAECYKMIVEPEPQHSKS
jgi:hypothetical protein